MTNDFVTPFDSAPALAALLGGQDESDYVDRRFATLSAARALGASRRVVARAEAGVASDRAERRRVRQGLFPVSGGFRENRGVTPGRYVEPSVPAPVRASSPCRKRRTAGSASRPIARR